jgi:hypothetical protein
MTSPEMSEEENYVGERNGRINGTKQKNKAIVTSKL